MLAQDGQSPSDRKLRLGPTHSRTQHPLGTPVPESLYRADRPTPPSVRGTLLTLACHVNVNTICRWSVERLSVARQLGRKHESSHEPASGCCASAWPSLTVTPQALLPGQTLLKLGCGPGLFTPQLFQAFPGLNPVSARAESNGYHQFALSRPHKDLPMKGRS